MDGMALLAWIFGLGVMYVAFRLAVWLDSQLTPVPFATHRYADEVDAFYDQQRAEVRC
jgi:hypothetical protein